MVRGYSIEELRALARGRPEDFCTRFRHAWLVWEPGPWRRASPFARTIRPDDEDTPPPLPRPQAQCVPLDVGEGPAFIRVGRSPQCEVMINDATVSRVHLGLARDTAGDWHCVALSASASYLEVFMTIGEAQHLSDGDQVRVGEVVLTLHGMTSMAERVFASAN